ncbi:hypothetical protein TVAG_467870 [Trichomonas vaginalis G3]|uniref:Uncharacterized protein n=1 Tax=Trichomonas vaginalis (strain ATCC PRA-98 / G3) TaxID=412133 RepID=A2E0M7_TRIV3|nr:hypothetical protein TVAGG3_0073960 [Trichomonas vaginalis G3]EAY13772.1 hypothetical protein TVAG_467870 [Trichomonas vaginalis G3]KAI5542711.1 hypothetical protein TVAGG3_0073960 [Trichomonas vaginalis G3]|eukprot:XP_001325995.1 hypothetical protein [Trichomonas vaginalis G3]
MSKRNRSKLSRKLSVDPRDPNQKRYSVNQELEQLNQNLSQKIETVERQILLLQKETQRIEKSKKSQIEELQNPDELIKQLNSQINAEKKVIEQNEQKQKEIKQQMLSLDKDLSSLSQKRDQLYQDFIVLDKAKKDIKEAEQKLQSQKNEQELILEKLMVLKNDLHILEGLEQKTEAESINKEVQQLKSEQEQFQREITNINSEIEKIQNNNQVFIDIYNKWKNKLSNIPKPDDSLEILVNQYKTQSKSRDYAKKHNLEHLQEIIVNNQNLQQTIFKEKKANMKRMKQIQQVKIEMKAQTSKMHEKLLKEEQKTINQIQYILSDE